MTWMICRYPHFRKPAITYSRSPALLSCLHRLWSDNLSRQLGAVAQPNGRRSKNQHHKTSNNCAFNHFHHICIHVCWYLLHGHFNYPNPSHSFKINQNHIPKTEFPEIGTYIFFNPLYRIPSYTPFPLAHTYTPTHTQTHRHTHTSESRPWQVIFEPQCLLPHMG